eukprot:scaffold18358_cov19-Prasinocladus_malaysianus.AAC.1
MPQEIVVSAIQPWDDQARAVLKEDPIPRQHAKSWMRINYTKKALDAELINHHGNVNSRQLKAELKAEKQITPIFVRDQTTL